ncbi:Tar ligand binding domain-containing protein, partial [Enterobacter roggenkampii]|uniref:Tar ligand binding domain-containing protein n=1 Tax=Enterobacter roggenkampii TaxID=1812935 RepID=UPI003C12FDAF
MLKNLHVITGIIFALTIFCLLQVVTGGLFYSAVSNDRHNFQNSGVLNAQQESLSDSVNTLVFQVADRHAGDGDARFH